MHVRPAAVNSSILSSLANAPTPTLAQAVLTHIDCLQLCNQRLWIRSFSILYEVKLNRNPPRFERMRKPMARIQTTFEYHPVDIEIYNFIVLEPCVPAVPLTSSLTHFGSQQILLTLTNTCLYKQQITNPSLCNTIFDIMYIKFCNFI